MLDLLLPVVCASCDRPAPDRLCERCGRAEARALIAPAEGVRWALALADYDGGHAAAVRAAKYRPERGLAVWLARWVAAHGAAVAVGFDWIVPVPSPWTRRAQRGFSCASIFARAVSERSGVPVSEALSLAPGQRQAALSRLGRGTNLRGRVRAVAPAPGRVLLVDDVLTTGATLGAAARELLGDASIEVCGLVACAATLARVDP
jgi:predicted amidophosphoribosyltransferase